MENKEQCYSQDNEKYTDYTNLMNDLKEFYNIGESVEVWEADKVEWNHTDFINIEDLIYSTQMGAMDACGEGAQEYLDDLTEDQKKDLKNHIAEWFNKNSKLRFYGVENEHKIMVVVD